MGGKKAHGPPLAHKESSLGLVSFEGFKAHRDPLSPSKGDLCPKWGLVLAGELSKSVVSPPMKCSGFSLTPVDKALMAESFHFQSTKNPFSSLLGCEAPSSPSSSLLHQWGWLLLINETRG